MSDAVPPLAIIPVYKRYDQRDRCLEALHEQTVAVDTFVHDNTTDNIGFTRACNRGLREALKRGCKYAMLINQDCYAELDAVRRLIELMEAHPRCAIAGPMQVAAGDPDLIVNAGGLVAYPFGRHRGGARRSQSGFASSEPISWANGACMFARMEAVVEFGLLDEGMFLIGSDSDWSLTARARGWEVWYCAEAQVQHEGGVTNAPPPTETQRIFHRDMDYWRRKWVGTVTHRQLDRPAGEPRITVPIPHAVHKAWSERQAGRTLDAEVMFHDILDVDPKNIDALNLLGVMAIQNGLVVVAHDYFREAVALAPTNAQLRVHLASTLASLEGARDDAAREYCEAMQLEARSPQLLETIAVELSKLGRSEEAAAARAKAQALRQATPPVQGTPTR